MSIQGEASRRNFSCGYPLAPVVSSQLSADGELDMGKLSIVYIGREALP